MEFFARMREDPLRNAAREQRYHWISHTFEPIPFGVGAARIYGALCAHVRARGRDPKPRRFDMLIAAVLVLILVGPRVGHTYRGQVYFAVAVGFIVAVLVARRVTGVRGIIWYLPGPLLVGLLGVLLAAWRPGLGAGYEHINVIPAWGLVRPLPVEMVGVGLVAILLTLRAATRLSSEQDRG